MNILITGSKGQLGSEILNISKEYSHCAFFFTDVEELDITNYESIKAFASSCKINAVINCAAYTAVDKAETEKELAYKINALGPKNLAQFCEEYGAKMIHISTDYVFDGTAHVPINESDLVSPLGVYGETKLVGEQFVLNTKSDSIVIRTSWLYSVYGNNFVKTMRRLGAEKTELSVVWDQVGTPTNASDLARVCVDIISQAGALSEKGKIYHYSNEGVASWYDFAHSIMEISGLKCTINAIESKDYPTPTKRPHYSVMNKAKIKNDFDILVPHWRDSLKTCIAKL